MEIEALSTRFKVKKITEEEIPAVLRLCRGNPLYYEYCPPAASAESIRADLAALPPRKTPEEKEYVGFYENGRLAAVMDLISRYPDEETAFIGFFMVDRAFQSAGVGSAIIAEALSALETMGFRKARLCYVKGNRQSKAFWEKNRFMPTGVEVPKEHYTVVVMERLLQRGAAFCFEKF